MRTMSLIAVFVLVVSALALPSVGATGWTQATVEPARQVYRQGETALVWINGTDSDAVPGDNRIDVYVFDGAGQPTNSWVNRLPGGATQEGPYVRTFGLGGATGIWRVNVHDTATANLIGSGTFLVLASGGVLDLEPSVYTGTQTYVPGETVTIRVVGATPSAQHSLAITMGPQSLQNTSLTTDSAGNAQTSVPLAATAQDGPNLNGENYLVQLTGATTDATTFNVKKFTVTVGVERSGYLAGETAKAHYIARNIKDNTPVSSGAGEWQLIRNSFPAATVRTGSISSGTGTIDISLAGLEVARYTLVVYYNATGSPPPNFGVAATEFAVGLLGFGFVRPANQSTVAIGSIVNVEMVAFVSGFGSSPLPDATVEVRVTKDGNLEAAYGQQGLITGGSGSTGYAFQVSTSEVEGKQLRIEATATKGSERTMRWVIVTISKSSVPGMQVALELERSDYVSGETLKGTVRGSVEGEPSKFNYVYIIYRTGGGGGGGCTGNIIVIVSLTSNLFTFAIPADLEGSFSLCVLVSDGQGNESGSSAPFTVAFARLLVNADHLTYKGAGEAFNFNFALVAEGGGTASYVYEIRDATGAMMVSGVPQGNGFSFSIPTNPTRTYTALVSASFGGHLLTGGVTIGQVVGIFMKVWVKTPSSLASGAFQPRDNIVLGFEFYSAGGVALPKVFRVDYATMGRYDVRSYLGTSNPGELQYTVPAESGDGTVKILLFGNAGGTGSIEEELYLTVDANANPLDLRVGGGVSLFHLIVFLILLFLLILLIARNRVAARNAFRKKDGPGGGSGGGGGLGGLFSRKRRGVAPAKGGAPVWPDQHAQPQQGGTTGYDQSGQQQWQPQPAQGGPQFDQYQQVQGQGQSRPRGNQQDAYIPPPGPG